jgi:hypothetical protein
MHGQQFLLFLQYRFGESSLKYWRNQYQFLFPLNQLQNWCCPTTHTSGQLSLYPQSHHHSSFAQQA